MLRAISLLTVLFLATIPWANGAIRLPEIFGSHMVLQREKPITIWGWADPGERILVRLNKQQMSAAADKKGEWKIILNPEAAGGPYQLAIKGSETIILDDILIGDVWICSGQSNMEWVLSSSNNAAEEISNANYPTIRHFKVPNTVASEPKNDFTGGDWEVCSPENAARFTAVGYFFARELAKTLNVPIGLINTSWGGTHVETWTSRRAFERSDEFHEMISRMPKLNIDSLAKKRNEETMARIQKYQGALPVDRATADNWKSPDFDASGWRTVEVPRLWENQEVGDVDGIVWLRREFTLPAAEKGKPGTLSLAMIDDSDQTYVNGINVGSTVQRYNERRIYQIPPGILKEGKNVVAVRVEDTGGGGGIYGDKATVNLKIGSNTMDLAGKWSYRIESLSKVASAVGPNSYPTLLFNAMIHPILPIGIKGALWYQGEANAGRAYQYRKAFPVMITDWRNHWKQGDFPFYFVQLASYDANHGTSQTGSGWAELREAQAMTRSLPNTGMAVTVDIGDPHDIHPRNKQDVGKRLAALALTRTYGKSGIDSGPRYSSMKVEQQKAIVSFDNVAAGLKVTDRYGYVKGFEIAGEDGKFFYAKAFISGNSVVVSHDEVNKPVAVRYGWADDASDCNLYNSEGFPAEPFRTDSWKASTEEAKFSF